MTRRNSPKAGPTAVATTAALLACMHAVPAAALAHPAAPQAAAPLPRSTTLHAFLDPPMIIVDNAIVTGPADLEVKYDQLRLAAHEEPGPGRGLLHGVRKPRNYPVCSKCALVSCRSSTKCSGHCKRKGRLYTCKTRRINLGISASISIRDPGPTIATADAPFVACMSTTDCDLPTDSLKGSIDGAALASEGARAAAECVLHDSGSAGACLCTYATPDAATVALFCETENGQGGPEVSSSFSVDDELEVRNGDQTVTVRVGAETPSRPVFTIPEFEAGKEIAAADAVVTTVDEEFGGDYSLEDYSADSVEYDLFELFRRSSFRERVSNTPSRPLEVEEEEQGEGGGDAEGGDDGAVAAAPPPAPLRVEEPPGIGAASGQGEAGADGGTRSEQRAGGEPAAMGSGAPKRMPGRRPARTSRNRSTRTPKKVSTPPSKTARTTSRNAERGRGGGTGQGARGRATVGKAARGGSASPARARKKGGRDKAGGSSGGGKPSKGRKTVRGRSGVKKGRTGTRARSAKRGWS